jgi:hypothetical protein
MSETAPKIYSAFWPLQISITCLGIWIGFQLFLLNVQRLQMNDRLDDIETAVQQANQSTQRMYALQKDLLDLSKKGNPNAIDIVRRHNLFVLGSGGSKADLTPMQPGQAPNSR